MLSIQMSDVINVLNTCRPYLIAIAVALVLAIVVMIACIKLPKEKKFMVRCQAAIAFVLVTVICVNLICFGPISTLLNLVSGGGTLSQETSDESMEMCLQIAEEGIVVMQNDDNVLPLGETSKLNVFGWSSTNPSYGGAGSGALSEAYPFVSLLDGLNQAGVETNTELSDFYVEYAPERPTVTDFGQDWTLPEPSVDKYTDELINNAKEFSDTAMVVVTRIGAETVDLYTDFTDVPNMDQHRNSDEYEDFPAGRSYLMLSQSEENMLDLVCENFDKVIFVINSANSMSMDFVRTHPQIKSVIWCPGTGNSGFESFGRIVSGAVNPSGKTADTWVTNVNDVPGAKNFGDLQYTNMDEYADRTNSNPFWPGVNYVSFVNYVEGIYLGYRYYETAYAEAEAGNYDFDYDEEVMYPFGTGMSYTTFEQHIENYKTSADSISFDVVVTNTGDVAGREVVQVYNTPPYYNGGIEKAAVNLVDFEKTDILEPGASQTFTFDIPLEDLASFDAHGHGCYVLEKGEYIISIRANAHEVIDSVTYTQASDIIYDEDNARSTDLTAATSQFQYAEGDITYLSRADGFANYDEATAAPSMELSEELKATFIKSENYVPESDPNDVMPTLGAKNGMKLAELRGLDYDDPKWDTLLDQLSIEDMNTLISQAGFQTKAIDSVGKVATVDCDGPASINNNFTGVGSVGLPSEVVLGGTWSKDMALIYGQSMGKMADEMDVSGWYAPGVNIHRNPYEGRCFEYLSEDGVLSGMLVAEAVKGAAESGVYAYVKHFACNEQESNRQRMLCTFLPEQALREIYIRPFEYAVKEGGTTAIMSSYNYIGTRWAGGTYELQTTVLRDEWGFRGFVLSDYWVGAGYMNADQAVMAGTDGVLLNYAVDSNSVKHTDNATTVQAMRRACHNIMYTVVNSRAYAEENLNIGPASWVYIAVVIDVIIAAVLLLIEWCIFKSYKKKVETSSK